MIGQTVSHYQIVQKIGEGGMGAVYRAQDLRLPRSVALKFLAGHMSANAAAKKRLVHEARAISSLDHPNISAIHEIDETPDGRMFIVMPYYEGRTLQEMLADGPLPVEQALDIVGQIGSGLAKAHDKGITHRDIKPANILVTDDGVAKVLDFGLAKLTDHTKLTREGITLGTLSYMSPEQATGDDVDHRTDIWSLGVVLYELLTQKLPFRGEIDQALVYCILHEAPRSITDFRHDTPPRVASVITKALTKNPAARFQHIGDFLTELGVSSSSLALPAGLPAAGGQADMDLSIVVLPFNDLSPDKGNEYFSDGLTEEIITDLSRVKAIRVISNNSAFVLKGTTKKIKTISAELNIRYVLRGSVRRDGDNLRISAQLVDAIDDSNVWADKFSGTMVDVFDIQEKVSRSIVDALEIHLSPQEIEQVAHHPIENVQAYECYLKARQEVYSYSEEGLESALTHLQAGLDIVGENALLYAGMAQAHFQYVNAGFKQLDYLETAEACVAKVLALEPESSHGHRLMGLIAFLRKQFQDSVTHFKQALLVDPNDRDSLFWLTHIYMLAGKNDAAAVLVDRLLKIDPLTPLNQAGRGWIHFFQGRFASALQPIREVYESDPQNAACRYSYIQMLVYNRHLDDAHRLTDQFVADTPEHPLAMLCLLLKHALQGKTSKAKKTVTPELQTIARSDPAYSWFVANCYALLKQEERALDWLENAVNIGFINYPFLLEHERLLDNVRDNDRFQQLLARVKTEWEQFEE